MHISHKSKGTPEFMNIDGKQRFHCADVKPKQYRKTEEIRKSVFM